MILTKVLINLLLVWILWGNIKDIKSLKVAQRKSVTEMIIIIIGVGVLIGLTYFYANTVVDYFLGGVGTIASISMWFREGIGSKGFMSMYRYKYLIEWSQIKTIKISRYDTKINIEVMGDFMEQKFDFKKETYEDIINILHEKQKEGADFEIVRK